MAEIKAKSSYTAADIDLLEGLAGVRKRPAMYIGSTNLYGVHHLVWEIVDNAVDEALNGYGNTIKITIYKDGSLSVEDEGRGIPVDIHQQTKMPAVQLIFTTLHSGGKFSNKAYQSSAGLHGVGSAVTELRLKFNHGSEQQDKMHLQASNHLNYFLHLTKCIGYLIVGTIIGLLGQPFLGHHMPLMELI